MYKTLLMVGGLVLFALLNGCGVREAIHRTDDRYARPGAMDFPLTGIYDTHQFTMLEKYRVTHRWVNSAGCGVSGLERPKSDPSERGRFFTGLRIYEEGNKTWSQHVSGTKPYDFTRYVRSIKVQSKIYAPPTPEQLAVEEKAWIEHIDLNRKTGRMNTFHNPIERKIIGSKEIETGLEPLCFEYWWTSSHYFRISLQKRTLKEMQGVFAERYPEGQWTTQMVNGLSWQVQTVPNDRLRPRPLNGLGGPFQNWLVPIGDTGYAFAMELGASKESLQYPEAHERFIAAFRHLIESVKIEPLQ